MHIRIQFLLLAISRMALSQLNVAPQIAPPSPYSSLPLNQAASLLAQPTAGLAQLPPGIAPLAASQTPNLASLGIGGLGVGGLNGLIGGNQLQMQTLQQLQALQGLGGLGIGLNGMGIPTNGATFIPLGQVLIPTGKEFTTKEICRNKGDNGGGNNQQNGFCPECANFGCCPGQFCLPECPPPCPSPNSGQQQYGMNQMNNQMQMGMGGMGGPQGGQQQFMMGNGGNNGGGYSNGGVYNNGGGQRKRRNAAPEQETILTLRNKIDRKVESNGGNEVRGMGVNVKGSEWTVFKYKVKST